jgi:hypothetical protein
MLGKGKMYKDTQEKTVEKFQDKPAELLFDDYDDIMEENVRTDHEPVPNIQVSDKINNLSDVVQSAVKQRNVKKILILFDDGTFQEM